jgi:hypothetical protein
MFSMSLVVCLTNLRFPRFRSSTSFALKASDPLMSWVRAMTCETMCSLLALYYALLYSLILLRCSSESASSVVSVLGVLGMLGMVFTYVILCAISLSRFENLKETRFLKEVIF